MGTQNATNYAKAVDPTAANIVDAAVSKGKIRVQTDNFTFAGESAGEIIKIGKLPKKSVLLGVILQHAALGASTTLQVGDAADDDRYITAKSTSSAGVLNEQDMAIGGNSYQQTADTEIIVTTAGGACTGQIKTQLIYSVE